MTQTVPTSRISHGHSSTFWRFQGWGLLVLIFLSFFPTQFHYQEYLFFSLLMLAVGVSWIEGQPILIRTPIDWPILLLTVWVLFTIPFAVDQAHSLTEWRKLAARILVFYWALLIFQRQGQKEFVFQVSMAVMVGAVALGGYAIFDFFERGGTLLDRGVRALAPSSHSHWLATYMVIAWPVMVFLLTRAKAVWQQLLFISALLLLSVAEFLAFSRGAWVAIACQIGFGVFLIGGRRKGFGVVLGILLCVVALWLINQKGYLAGIFDMKSVADRLGCWKLGIEESLTHPIFGVGFGNDTFSKIYPGDPPGLCSTGSELPTGAHLHNTVLMFAMGSGIPALIMLMWIIFKSISVLVVGVKHSTLEGRRGFQIAAALVFIGFWVCAFFNYLFTGSLAYLVLMVLAGGMSFWRIPSSNASQTMG